MTTKTLKDVMEQAATWPREDQDELAEYAREIEARRTAVYTMSDDERVAVGKGLAEADRGEFVPDELVAREAVAQLGHQSHSPKEIAAEIRRAG
jgi:predicted transcriptional regulator